MSSDTESLRILNPTTDQKLKYWKSRLHDILKQAREVKKTIQELESHL